MQTMQTCPFISNTVKISGPNRSGKVTDHFICISTNVFWQPRSQGFSQPRRGWAPILLSAEKSPGNEVDLLHSLYAMQENLVRRNREDVFREHLRDVDKKNTTQMRPNWSRVILIFLFTPTTT